MKLDVLGSLGLKGSEGGDRLQINQEQMTKH